MAILKLDTLNLQQVCSP